MQAARGASLNPDDPQVPAPTGRSGRPPGRRRGRAGLFVGVALVVLAVDQVTKVWAVANLQGREPIQVVPGFLSLTFLRNPGAAFGLGASVTVVLSLVAVGVCVAVVRMARRLRDPWWALALALLLAGALGNLSDRLFRSPGPLRGHVVDFIDYNGWFVGNVADVALTLAALLLLIRTWQGVRFDGTREDSSRD